MNDDEPLDFLSKVFCFVLGSDYDKWKKFFVSSLKGRTNLNREILLYAAYDMVKNFSIAFFLMNFLMGNELHKILLTAMFKICKQLST